LNGHLTIESVSARAHESGYNATRFIRWRPTAGGLAIAHYLLSGVAVHTSCNGWRFWSIEGTEKPKREPKVKAEKLVKEPTAKKPAKAKAAPKKSAKAKSAERGSNAGRVRVVRAFLVLTAPNVPD
jgi:hypothetical protein